MKRKSEEFNHYKDLNTNSNQRRKFECSKRVAYEEYKANKNDITSIQMIHNDQ